MQSLTSKLISLKTQIRQCNFFYLYLITDQLLACLCDLPVRLDVMSEGVFEQNS